MEIMCNELHHSIPPHATIAHALHALADVPNIEFSMLHVAPPNDSTAQIYCEVHMVRERPSRSLHFA